EITEEYTVVRRQGPADYAIDPPRAGGPASQLVDIDGDGDLDGIHCGERQHSDTYGFRVCLNDGTGLFGPSIFVPTGYAARIAGAADVDQDGDLDLIGASCVLFNLGRNGIEYCPPPAAHPARLFGSGTASLTRADLLLEASDLPANSFGHVFYGTETQTTPLGAGILCVGGAWIRRLPVSQANGLGQSVTDLYQAGVPTQGIGACLPGDTRYFQLWYRDPQAFSNLTNGYAITFAP
ncbi:MAG: VCBS repeat-containing protein, partial [Planctomycetota bacterium]